jgi:acyl-CoA hydrolase/GNAT superfamily N-acetyltransferase
MAVKDCTPKINELKEIYPEKFVSEDMIFKNIHPGDVIFIGTACGEPQYLVGALIKYVEENPKAFFDTEVLNVWTLGVAPYTEEKFARNFRHNSFFIGNATRDAINKGVADYTPINLSEVPDMFKSGAVPVDVALIQVSPPDEHGYVSMGISVDIVSAAQEMARTVIAQVNTKMPRVHGDTFIHISELDYIIHHDEPLLEFESQVSNEIARNIGQFVSRIVKDRDTIQVGYGSLPNAILMALRKKHDLGVHTELFTDGIADLMKAGVITNKYKTIEHEKTVAAFCMGKRATYEFLDDNPGVEFKPCDWTNDPLIISRHNNMTAINSGLEIDLTGQATAESVGKTLYSGIGGQADFMRGAVLAPGGKTILAMQSTANNETISRIVPFLKEGAGVTLTRGDVHYIVTEYGIAYLHGKNIRERAMDLIAIAHPKFRPWLIKEAKKLSMIYADQAFIPGKKGEYPVDLETYRTTRSGLTVKLRPVKISDEEHLKHFFYSISDQSLYKRFMSARKDMPHERLQEFVVIDYTKEMVILVTTGEEDQEKIIGVGQYGIDEATHSAEVALLIRDEIQGQGVGTELLKYLTYLARRHGLHGFTASVLVDNRPMLNLFEKGGFDISRQSEEGVYELKMMFRSVPEEDGK